MEKEKINFKCNGCGKCCTSFKDEEARTEGLPLLDWEIDRLTEEAGKIGIKLDIKTTGMIFDKRSNLTFAPVFHMNNEPCPFLDDSNRCSIYEKRPIVCRIYPVITTPLTSDGIINKSCFGNCPNLDAEDFLKNNLGVEDEKETRADKRDTTKEFIRTFGEEMIIYSLIYGNFNMIMEDIMKEMIENKKVKLRKVGKFDYYKHKPVTLLEFFIKRGAIPKDSREEFVNIILDYERNKKEMYSIIDKTRIKDTN